METFEQTFNESLKDIGKIKLRKRPDPLKSHRFKMARGINRKTLEQVPMRHMSVVKKPDVQSSFAHFIRGLEVSNRMVDIAKKSPSGVWRISKGQVLEIAKKYKFNVPSAEKPMKHLGSTGIQLVRYKPGIYYLYKPHRKLRKKRIKSAIGKAIGHFNMGFGK